MCTCVFVSIAAAAPIVLTMWEAKFLIRQTPLRNVFIDGLFTKVGWKPLSNPGHKRAFVCGIALVVGAIFFNYVLLSCLLGAAGQSKETDQRRGGDFLNRTENPSYLSVTIITRENRRKMENFK